MSTKRSFDRNYNMIHNLIDNRIAILTMEADGRNAMSAEDLRTLASLLREHDASGEVDGIILTGANHAFCAGLAYNPQQTKEPQLAELFPALEEALLALRAVRLPLVCAVTGHAIGAGMLMMCTADAVFMTDSPKAKYGLPEVMLGLHITKPMADTLRMRFSEPQIRRMLFGGNYVDVETLRSWTLLDGVEPEDELLDEAKDYINVLRDHLESVRHCKEVL